MKNLYLIILFVSQTYSQNQKNIIKVEYKETIQYSSEIQTIFSGELLSNNEKSVYKSSFVKRNKLNENNDTDKILIETDESNFVNEIYVSKKENLLTENLHENLFLKKSYSVYEEIPKIKWLFLKETIKINNYHCKKATAEFRGRKYNVWYTEQIPITAGPWKFSGLPGLIMLIEDFEGIYKWEVRKIEYPYTSKNIDINLVYSKRFKFTKKSFQEYDNIFIAAINDKIDIINSRNKNKEFKSYFEYSTFQLREPINEFRKQMIFK
uniref:GLPGLI family protein n=3 Tax=Flavobacterium sp. TaxID=239 RepID=UPI004049A73A